MSGLFAWWPLHEMGGGTTHDLKSRFNGDINGPIPGVRGVGGLTSYSFDGTDDQINCPEFPADSWEEFTLSCFIRPEEIRSGTMLSTGGNGAASNEYGFVFNHGHSGWLDDRLSIYISNSVQETQNHNWSLNLDYPTTEFHHVAITFDGNDSNGVEGFLDGESLGTKSNDRDYVEFDGDRPTYIGREWTGTGGQQYFTGEIQDLRVYNRVLSHDDIRTLSVWGSADLARPPVDGQSYWPFDDDSDTSTATDEWGTNDGTIYGAVYTSDSIRGNALEFDGVDDFVDLGVSSIDLGLDLVSAFTVSLWVRTQEPGDNFNTPIFSAYDRDVIDGFHIVAGSGDIRAVISRDNGVHNYAIWEGSTVGEWYHVVGIFDNTTYEPAVYVNGIRGPVENFDAGVDDFPHVNTTMKLARQANPDERYFACDIDDVRIYDYPIELGEISQLYRWGTRGRDMRKLTVNAR